MKSYSNYLMNTPHSICYVGHSHGGFTKHFLPAMNRIANVKLSFIAIEEKEFIPKPRIAGIFWSLTSILKYFKNTISRFSEQIYWSMFCYQHKIDFVHIKVYDEELLISLLKNKYFVLSAGIRQKFSPAVLAAPKNGIINFHYGKLPQYRGTHPVFWQKWNNESSFAYSFHTMASTYDAGDIILQNELNINGAKSILEISSLLIAHASYQLPDVFELLSLQKAQNESEAHIYTNADYIKVISFECLKDTIRLTKILNTSKYIIFKEKHWMELSGMEPAQSPFGLFTHGAQLRYACKDHTLFIKKINYLPAVLYYYPLKKDLNDPDGIQ